MFDNTNTYRGISYSAGFFILIAFAITALMVIAGFINPWIWTSMTGKSIDVLQKGLAGPEDSNAMKVIQAITAIGGFFIPAVLTASLIDRKPGQLLGFNGTIKPSQAALVVLIIGVSLIVSTGLSYFNTHIPLPQDWRIKFDKWEDEYNQQVESIISLKNNTDYIISLVVMAFIPALCEETLFRGGLQNFLGRSTSNPWLAILVVSLLFSLAHFSFYGFLYRFFLGVVLGALYQYSGRLWLSILAHFINNAIALSVLYFYTKQGRAMEDAMRDNASGYWGIFFLPVVIILFVLFRRISVPRRYTI